MSQILVYLCRVRTLLNIWFSSKFDFRKLSTSADGNILDRLFFFFFFLGYVEKFESLLKT